MPVVFRATCSNEHDAALVTWLVLIAAVSLCVVALNALSPRVGWWRPLSFALAISAAETTPFFIVLSLFLTGLLVFTGGLALLFTPLGAASAVLLLTAAALFAVVAVGARKTMPLVHAGLGFTLTAPPYLHRLRPFARWPRAITRTANLAYGPAGRRNLLDVYRTAATPPNAPVLVWIHGGGWLVGSKWLQGRVLLQEFVRHGFVGVAINYRLSPRAKWPAHLDDCRLALQWVKQHVAAHGGDPSRIVVAGGSAGGHLATQLALTPRTPDEQVQGVISFYGVYDVGAALQQAMDGPLAAWMAKRVFGTLPSEQPELYRSLSPMFNVTAAAPPMLLVHGTADQLVPVEQMHRFATTLQATSKQRVDRLELPGAIHAFDVWRSYRSALVAQACRQWAQVLLAVDVQRL